jgi:hypothetical protein
MACSVEFEPAPAMTRARPRDVDGGANDELLLGW